MPKDYFGRLFSVDDTVFRAYIQGTNTPLIYQCKVTRIEDGKVYLDNSKVALKYPERVIITTEYAL